MKNFVGINYSKEYLPHHTLGDVENGGDEYFQQTILKKHAAWLRTQRDIIRVKSEKHTLNEWYRLLYKYENFIRRIDNRLAGKEILDKVTEGTWYGNDTLWRTVLDLNKIVHYSSKVGNVKKNKQRVVIHLCDMIVSGDREGPLAPSEKEENILLFGTNGVELDALIVRLMHFKISMLRSIDTALKDRLLESKPYEEIIMGFY